MAISLNIIISAWSQGQFIQQIPVSAQPNMEGYTQQYANGLYQTTYQQPPFDGNTFYSGAVQVLTNSRPPSAPNHPQLTPRANGSYSHTPSPVSAQQQPATPHSSAPQRQYHQEYQTSSPNYVTATATPSSTIETPQTSSVSNTVSSSPNNQNFTQQNGSMYPSVSSTSFSPGTNVSAPNYVVSNINSNSGNVKPGHPQVNSNPQLVSLNSSGCPGNKHYGGNDEHIQQHANWEQASHQHDNQLVWEHHTHNNKEHAQKSHKQQQKVYEPEHADSNKTVTTIPSQQTESNFSQADRVNLNTKLKTMILNKQLQIENKREETLNSEHGHNGHFLSYNHHHHLYSLGEDGGKKKSEKQNKVCNDDDAYYQKKYEIKRDISQTTIPIYKVRHTLQSETEVLQEQRLFENNFVGKGTSASHYFLPLVQNCSIKTMNDDNLKTNVGLKIPLCKCFPPGQFPPEPGSYYTHLGKYLFHLEKLRIHVKS